MVKGFSTLVVSLATVTSILAQSSNVTECIPEYQWSINSRGQTPCLVGAFLESSCGIPTSVNQIPPGNHYIGPSFALANPCTCNSVVYSLISACGGCQNRTFTDYTTWALNCVSLVPVGQFPKPVPGEVELPSWARLDISLTNNTFDPLAAEREAERAAAFPSSTSSGSTLATSKTPPPSSTPSSNSSSVPNDSGGLSSGAIAGITIGALIFVIIVLLFIFWMTLQAKRRRNPKPAPLDEPFSDKYQTSSPLPFVHAHARSLSDPASAITPYPYSASDLNYHPVSPGASTLYTTAPAQTPIDGTGSPRSPKTAMTVQSPGNLRGYTGAAEV